MTMGSKGDASVEEVIHDHCDHGTVLTFDVLVEGEEATIECLEQGIYLSDESTLFEYDNIVYFEIPRDDSRDVFEYDQHLHYSAKMGTGEDEDDDEDSEHVFEGLYMGVLWFIRTVSYDGEPEMTPTSLHLEFQALSDLQTFQTTVKDHLSRLKSRPKKVLLFLNPASGRGKAVETYESYLIQIFRLAEISADVRITEKEGPNSVQGILFSIDYSQYDAIVIVGGDGSYRDAVTALLENKHNSGLVNLDSEQPLPPIDIRFAIIPTGSGNGVVHYLTRSFETMQAAFALVLGRTTPLPVVAVRNLDDTLIGLAIVCVNYGITSDAIVVANKWKFLGPGKYIVGVTSAMLKHKSFRAALEFDHADGGRSRESSSSEEHSSSHNCTAASAKCVKGEFKDIMMLVNGIADADEIPRMPRNCSDFFVTPSCTLFQQTGFLLNLGMYSQKIYSDPNVSCYKTKFLNFKLTDSNQERLETKNFINIDGDIYPIRDGAFKISYHPNIVNACALGFIGS